MFRDQLTAAATTAAAWTAAVRTTSTSTITSSRIARFRFQCRLYYWHLHADRGVAVFFEILKRY
jgi:hypothetical protein